MQAHLPLVLLVVPAGLLGVALLARRTPGARPRVLLAAARAATATTLVIALLTALLTALSGPTTSTTLGGAGVGLSLRLDALSATLFLLVALVGAVVVRFSERHLDGDPRQGVFVGRLALTLAAVVLLVLAGNLALLVAAWIGTSLALHRLLLFYPERRGARVAARKKFVTARIGDACLVAAALLLAHAFGSADIATIAARAAAAAGDGVPAGTGVAATLLAVAALLKSAQFPTHGWLTEVMETPTPVSALLHAGIINAGGFLVIRFADVMVLHAPALHLLALVGGFTALVGAVVMLAQTSIKAALAWSTVAQMGFMLLQCGLGLFALAALHLVAHSLYKAHAFLSAGSVVELARGVEADAGETPGAGALLAALGAALAIHLASGVALGVLQDAPLQVHALGAVLVMGLVPMMARAATGGRRSVVVGRILLAASGTTLAWHALHAGAGALFAGVAPAPVPPGPLGTAVLALAVVSFASVAVLQLLAPARRDAAAWHAARVHLANGLYANAVFDRLVGALARPIDHHTGADPR